MFITIFHKFTPLLVVILSLAHNQSKESLDILSKKKYNEGDSKQGAVRVPGPGFKSPSDAETTQSQGKMITSDSYLLQQLRSKSISVLCCSTMLGQPQG